MKEALRRLVIGDTPHREGPERRLGTQVPDPFETRLAQGHILAAAGADRAQMPAEEDDGRVVFDRDAGIAAVADRGVDRMERRRDGPERAGIEGLLKSEGKIIGHSGVSGA